MTTITAKEAYSLTRLPQSSLNWIWESIHDSVYNAALQGKLHTDWYSDRLMNITESQITFIKQQIGLLEEQGFKCHYSILNPTPVFPERRIRIHISWENQASPEEISEVTQYYGHPTSQSQVAPQEDEQSQPQPQKITVKPIKKIKRGGLVDE